MPTITSISPTSGPTTGGTSVTITGTGFAGPTTVRFGTTATTFTLDSSTQITAIAPAGSVGTVQVTVTTSAGTSNGVPYTYLAVPALSSINPGQGSTAGGTTVTLTGSGLTGATAVNFGGAPAASFTVDSDTQITAVSPAGTGFVSVTVTGPGGTSNPVTYIYVVVPTITSISPTAGPTAGGNNVTITGTGFTGPLTVRFGTTATTFTVNSATQITAIAPAHAAGTVPVTVTGSGGTSNSVSYTYAAVPTLTGAVPNTGPVAGGTTVVLTGTGLTGATSVSFGGTPATSFTVDSATQITAVAPARAAGTVQITATTAGGTSNGIAFTYV
ncbi:IPT/TIG domain-containing protein [Nocardia amikacinitolerans]|uniref:IPT/TIG domain-containing protein n=1 Tax=Nocardia amikacinitolerans TaxID=756689 RepID=A0A285LCF3_9NOCA|nr:IPT/TIG domain-containing protein [Nocardia amikacinitolerans]MCP2280467.1 IPT/TIG domain-containing protein [Nocardia amikacinitolerans]SNY81687.1 IPT/TIG domain-containing protein [Nocardia amikacinitolerans]